MYTDMVGYTALGQRNESLSLALVEEQRKLIRPILNRHNGREVKTMGDAFLIELPSALDAVRCAYDVQRATREFNISLPEERRIHLRIGVHLGDVVESQGDISGDAVNVASRIEQLAEDGGVCLTRQVYDHVENKFELPLRSLGIQHLKNVSAPLEVYKILMPWSEGKTTPSADLDKKRIAVLPFANMSPDPADGYFAEGMTEELITTLSKIREISVISRTSVMQYSKNPKPMPAIAQDLRTGTILEGSVRKSGDRIRITIQMIDAHEDKHVWAETYDRGLEDIFTIQSDISQSVAQELRVQLLGDERRRLQSIPTRNTKAYMLFLKGRNYVNERGREAFLKAKQYFEEAIKQDPNYASAYAGLSDCYHLLENWGFMEPEAAWPKATEYARKAVELDDTLAEAHASMAMSLSVQEWDWKGSEREYKRALELNPSFAPAHHWYAVHHLQAQRRWDENLQQMREAVRLDPFSAVIGTNLGWALFLAGQREEGIKQFRSILEINPDFVYAHFSLGETLVSVNSVEEGTSEIERALNLNQMAEPKAMMVYACMAADKRTSAQKALEELTEISKQQYVPDTWFAVAFGALGDKEKALERFARAIRFHNSSVAENVNKPYFDSLRKEARFQALLKEIGLG
jgi:TolB-like protein/class 3 adenylate cyclase/Tfp pilus assembly protein PilF